MMRWRRGWTLLHVLLWLWAGRAVAQVATTAVQDTVYRADGTAAAGSVVVSWSAFTTALGRAVAAGSTVVTIGAGGSLSVNLSPNAGATPMGSYYTAVYHLDDGSTSREYWVVPVLPAGSSAVTLSGIRNSVLPLSVAMQTVSKSYVDTAIAAAFAGHPLDSAAPWVTKAGDTMTGPLVLPGDPVSALQAADKNYVDARVAAISTAVFGPSGTTHSTGMVPDPGAVAGSTRFLREDGTFAVPAASAGGAGSVTSVGLALPAIFSVSGSPVTGSGTLTGTLNAQSANQFLAGPASGAAATPVFRAIAPGDVPTLNQSTTGSAGSVLGTGVSIAYNPLFSQLFITVGGTNGFVMSTSNTSLNTPLSVSGTITAPIYSTSVTALSGAAPALDASKGLQTITLSANTTATISGIFAGERVSFQICQPASGGPYTWAWPAAVHGGMAIGTAAGTCSMQSFNSFNGSALVAESAGVSGVAP